MNANEFVHWLRGFFDSLDTVPLKRGEKDFGLSLTHEQVRKVRKSLAECFGEDESSTSASPSPF